VKKILITSENGDIPENLSENTIYYAIRHSSSEIKIAASKTNADSGSAITIYVLEQKSAFVFDAAIFISLEECLIA